MVGHSIPLLQSPLMFDVDFSPTLKKGEIPKNVMQEFLAFFIMPQLVFVF